MPSFYGWCDICVDFYPISREEWETQLVESAQIALNTERNGKRFPAFSSVQSVKRSKTLDQERESGVEKSLLGRAVAGDGPQNLRLDLRQFDWLAALEFA